MLNSYPALWIIYYESAVTFDKAMSLPIAGVAAKDKIEKAID